jgi:hypothetical protein
MRQGTSYQVGWAAVDATAAALAPSSGSWHPEPDGAVRTPPKAPVRFVFSGTTTEMRSKLLEDGAGILTRQLLQLDDVIIIVEHNRE